MVVSLQINNWTHPATSIELKRQSKTSEGDISGLAKAKKAEAKASAVALKANMVAMTVKGLCNLLINK